MQIFVRWFVQLLRSLLNNFAQGIEKKFGWNEIILKIIIQFE